MAMQPEDATPLCLRCVNVRLQRSADSGKDITFFECPSCHRRYAKAKSGSLTFRWLNPITLPLYSVLFSKDAMADAPRVADSMLRQNSPDELAVMIKEIELELEHPTQQLREILDNPQSEEACRQFLAAVVRILRESSKVA
jgi:hypothetical protein